MKVLNFIKWVNFLTLSVCFSAWAHAEKSKLWDVSVVLGFGVHESALINEETLKTFANINVSYFGEYWFFDSGDFGLTLVNNDVLTFNLISHINTTSLYFSDPIYSVIDIGGVSSSGSSSLNSAPDETSVILIPTNSPTSIVSTTALPNVTEEPTFMITATFVPTVVPSFVVTPTVVSTREPMPEEGVPIYDYVAPRNIALEAGAEILVDVFGGTLQANILHDISAQHGGFHGGVSFSRGFKFDQFSIISSVDIGFQSPEYNDYYWGVKEHERMGWLIPYKGQWGINASADITLSQRFDQHWSVVAVIRQRWVGTIVNSPLVDDEYLSAGFTGVRYEF
jgi:hypothetical protein